MSRGKTRRTAACKDVLSTTHPPTPSHPLGTFTQTRRLPHSHSHLVPTLLSTLVYCEAGFKMSTTNDDEPSFTEFPSKVTYTEAVPIRMVAPITEPSNNNNNNNNNNKKSKNKVSSKSPKGPKTPTKINPSISKKSKKKTTLRPNVERKNLDTTFDESKFDLSNVPPPVCCCTGVPRQCHKCGVSGWQSSCCTSKMSAFPLPMSPWRPGARVSGRKMSHGAYRKLLCKLASEGHDLSQPVDLKPHWAKHGTNNFVTIK